MMEQEFVFRCCGLGQLDVILDVEREAVELLDRPDLLRRNTVEMWKACLQPPHYCLGAWVGEELAAFAVLYVPEKGSVEDLSTILNIEAAPSANFKICIVRPQWRGHHLQVLLGRRLQEEARRRGFRLLCATASPYNKASIRSLEELGYKVGCTVEKYGFERLILYRFN